MNENSTFIEKSKLFRSNAQDCKTCMTLMTVVYSPLAIMLGAAVFLI